MPDRKVSDNGAQKVPKDAKAGKAPKQVVPNGSGVSSSMPPVSSGISNTSSASASLGMSPLSLNSSINPGSEVRMNSMNGLLPNPIVPSETLPVVSDTKRKSLVAAVDKGRLRKSVGDGEVAKPKKPDTPTEAEKKIKDNFHGCERKTMERLKTLDSCKDEIKEKIRAVKNGAKKGNQFSTAVYGELKSKYVYATLPSLDSDVLKTLPPMKTQQQVQDFLKKYEESHFEEAVGSVLRSALRLNTTGPITMKRDAENQVKAMMGYISSRGDVFEQASIRRAYSRLLDEHVCLPEAKSVVNHSSNLKGYFDGSKDQITKKTFKYVLESCVELDYDLDFLPLLESEKLNIPQQELVRSLMESFDCCRTIFHSLSSVLDKNFADDKVMKVLLECWEQEEMTDRMMCLLKQRANDVSKGMDKTVSMKSLFKGMVESHEAKTLSEKIDLMFSIVVKMKYSDMITPVHEVGAYTKYMDKMLEAIKRGDSAKRRKLESVESGTEAAAGKQNVDKSKPTEFLRNCEKHRELLNDALGLELSGNENVKDIKATVDRVAVDVPDMVSEKFLIDDAVRKNSKKFEAYTLLCVEKNMQSEAKVILDAYDELRGDVLNYFGINRLEVRSTLEIVLGLVRDPMYSGYESTQNAMKEVREGSTAFYKRLRQVGLQYHKFDSPEVAMKKLREVETRSIGDGDGEDLAKDLGSVAPVAWVFDKPGQKLFKALSKKAEDMHLAKQKNPIARRAAKAEMQIHSDSDDDLQAHLND